MIQKKVGSSKAIRIQVVVSGAEVAHAYLYLIKNDLNEKPYALLEDLFVEENSRGKGFARELIGEVINTAKAEGCYKIIATSRFSRERVHEMYKKAGFVEHGTEFRLNLK